MIQERQSGDDDVSEVKNYARKEFVRIKIDVESLEEREAFSEDKINSLQNSVSILKTILERSKNNVLMNGFRNRLDKLEAQGEKVKVFADMIERDRILETLTEKMQEGNT